MAAPKGATRERSASETSLSNNSRRVNEELQDTVEVYRQRNLELAQITNLEKKSGTASSLALHFGHDPISTANTRFEQPIRGPNESDSAFEMRLKNARNYFDFGLTASEEIKSKFYDASDSTTLVPLLPLEF